ncbi:hypothetical protein [Streptomyces sp. KLOTTS4A1]|uniref:hypothetical protein n=1 Tax=Streptomyces sp. KLOTTS4A1 TaxID=3390996 RepID=UPI0039F562ED
MSLRDELTAAQRCLEDLNRAIARLEQQVSPGLDIRRVHTDAEHLRDSLTLLREAAAPGTSPQQRPEMVGVPDAPYDRSLWADADDEGLGASDRHAP